MKYIDLKWLGVLRSKTVVTAGIILSLFFTSGFLAQCTKHPLSTIPVIPGAQGFGTLTPAGRGGHIIAVSTLNDDGPGSLRSALAYPGPRTVVFEVGGAINLRSNLEISSPYVTVAGQTAPPPGIMLRGGGIIINTHDVLLQHLVIRPGPDAPDPLTDGVSINDSRGWNVVLDHLSLQWAPDEQISTWIGSHDITVSNCIVAEGVGEQHGMLIGDGTRNIMVTGNLFAHNGDRSPAQKGGTSVVYVNNLVYNPGGWEHYYLADNGYDDPDGDGFSGPLLAAVVGNLFIDGRSSTNVYTGIGVARVHPESKVFQGNNLRFNGRTFSSKTPETNVDLSLIDLEGYRLEWDLEQVFSRVLQQAGARPNQRDAVDERIVAEVASGGGSVPNSPPVYPLYPESYRKFIVPVDPHGDSDNNGYTNIEDLLHQMAAEVEQPNSSQAEDMQKAGH